MPKFDNQKYTHPDHKKLHLFRRPNSPYWWCGFHNKGIYHRTTTKCKNKPDANDFADEWYFNQQVEIRSGKIPQKIKEKNLPTVKDASILALQEYRILVARGDRSEQYLVGVIKYLNKHVLPFFGNMAVEEVDAVQWHKFTRSIYNNNPTVAISTLKQIRNSLNICMNSAINEGWIKSVPKFKITSQSTKNKKGRVWFKPDEVEILLKALDEHVELQKHTPKRIGSQELRDYVKFMLYTGLRVYEANNITFNNIEIIRPENKIYYYIMIRNIKGKRGIGDCKANVELNGVYNSILNRVQPRSFSEKIFVKHHRDMFNVVLNNCNLKHDTDGRKRDFISLRHTYICNKILDRVPIYDIAINCRTSPDMIDKHYAKYLNPELLKSLHEATDKIIDPKIAKAAHLMGNADRMKKKMAALMIAISRKLQRNSKSEEKNLLKSLSTIIDREDLEPYDQLFQCLTTVGLSPKDAHQMVSNDEDILSKLNSIPHGLTNK